MWDKKNISVEHRCMLIRPPRPVLAQQNPAHRRSSSTSGAGSPACCAHGRQELQVSRQLVAGPQQSRQPDADPLSEGLDLAGGGQDAQVGGGAHPLSRSASPSSWRTNDEAVRRMQAPAKGTGHISETIDPSFISTGLGYTRRPSCRLTTG